MSVVPLQTEVVLDEDAVHAERRALLAELAAERFGAIHLHREGRPNAKEIEAAEHLERAAELARQIAVEERRRCAVPSGGASTRRGVER